MKYEPLDTPEKSSKEKEEKKRSKKRRKIMENEF